MKRLLFLTVLVFASWCVYGQGQEMCNRAFNHAVNLYNTGRYKEAKMQFEWCGDHCGSSYTGWLEKCNTAIDQQEQAARRRRQAEIEAIRRKEAEAIARAQRIKDNQFIFLSSSSPVLGNFSYIESDIQGKIRQVNPSLRFINDSSEAYYAARIVVNIDQRPGAKDNMRNYDVCAAVEIEDLTTGEFLGRFLIKEGDGCSSNIPEESAEEFVANKIYSRNDFFNCIAEGISNVISNKSFNPDDCYVRDQNLESASRKKTVVLVYGPDQIEDAVVNVLRSSMTNALINDERKWFTVLDHTKEMSELIRDEVIYSEGHVTASEIAKIGVQKGAEWACAIIISSSKDCALHFECKVVDVNSSEIVLQGQYNSCDYFVNYPITTIDNATAQHVVRHLAYEIGSLSDLQKKELMEDDQKKQNDYNRSQTVSALCAFVPGLYQLRSDNNKTKGALFIVGESLCIGGIVFSQNMRQSNIKKMNGTNNANLIKMYADKANTYTTVRNVSIGAAAAVYVWNVVDAFVTFGKKKKEGHVGLYPVVTDESVAISLSINF